MVTADKAKILQKIKHFGVLYASFTALFILYFAPVVLTGNLLAPDDDRTQSLPAFLGERTIWSPLQCSGWPLHADPLAQTWYPFSFLLSKLPLSCGWNLFIVSGYSLSSVFLYLYVRELTGKKFPALISALLFPLSGSMIGEMRHAPVIHSMVYMTAILFVVEKLSRRSSLGWLCCGIAAVGLSVLNGHMQFVAYILGLVVLYVVFRCFTMKEGQSAFLKSIAIMIITGLALGAVQILPTWELTKFSVRSKFAFIDFLSYCCHPIQAIGLVTPFVLGAMNSTFFKIPYFGLDFRPPHFLYLGILPMISIFGSLFLIRSNAINIFWLVAGTLCFLLSFGNATPLAWLLYNIPPFGSFRALSLLYVFAAMSYAIVTGIVLSKLMEEKLLRRRIVVFAASLICLFWGAISLSVQMLQEIIELPERSSLEGNLPPFWENPAILVPTCGSLFLLTVFLIWLRNPNSKPLQAVLLAVAIADVAFVGWFGEWRSLPVTVSSIEKPPPIASYAEQLKGSRQRLLPVRGVSGGDDEAPPNLSRLWGMPSASGFGPLLNTRYLEVLGMTEGGFLPVPWTFTTEFRGFDVLAVKYLIVPYGDTRIDAYKVGGQSIYRKIGESGRAEVYENTRAMPRAWLVGETQVMPDADVVRTIRRGEYQNGETFDPAKVALLSNSGMKAEGFVEPPKEIKVSDFAGIAKIVSIENAEVSLESESSTDAFLVLSDLFYPGWKVTVDGKPQEIIRTNYVLRGVSLTAGKHSITFRYEPMYLYAGSAISLLALLAFAGLIFRAVRQTPATES